MKYLDEKLHHSANCGGDHCRPSVEGHYYCSMRTLYHLLKEEDEVRERRHPQYFKPELLAIGPNRLWSWNITKLEGPANWTYFYLYVILAVFIRYVVGWMVVT